MANDPSRHWATLDRWLNEALDLPASERGAFVARIAAREPELAARLARLLEHAEEDAGSLTPGGAWAGALAQDLEGQLGGADEIRPGQRLGRYLLLEEVGRGGMAVVFRAERADGDFQQVVAVKVLKRGLDTDEVVRRFARERAILAAAAHPALARLLDAGVAPGGRPYLVLEYVAGRPIDRYADDEGLDVPARLGLFLQVVRAVAAAHRNLVVHRDIKPSNLLVTADGHVKLLDFGIAKLLDPTDWGASALATRTGLRPMTPAFASPEQLTGGVITTATDIYQLGLLLHLLLTGVLPAPGKALAVAGELGNLVQAAVHPEPERRYGSAAELAADVERYLTGRPLAARPDTWAYRGAKFLRRHRAAALIAALAAAALMLTVALYTARLRSERDRATAAANRATRIVAVLRGMFSAASPQQARGEEVSARALLQQGARRVLAELPDEPELAADLLQEIGEISTELALFAEAADLLDRAVALRRAGNAAPLANPRALAGALQARGRVAFEQGDYPYAHALLAEALDLRRTELGATHADTARSADALGRVVAAQGDFGRAQELLAGALQVFETALGPAAPEVGYAELHLGELASQRADIERARARFSRSLAILGGALGADHPAVLEVELELADLDRGVQDFAAASARYERVLPLVERIYGTHHPRFAKALLGFAVLRGDEGRIEESLALLRRVREVREAALGVDHPQVAEVWNAIGLAERDAGRLEAAAAAFRRSLAGLERSLGRQHVDVATPLLNLARLLERTGPEADALAAYERVITLREAALGRDHPTLTVPLSRRGDLRLAAGDLAGAEQDLLRVLALSARVLGTEHAMEMPRAALGEVLWRQGRQAEAEALLRPLAEGQEVDERARERARRVLAALARGARRG